MMLQGPKRALWAGGGLAGVLLVLLSLNIVWMARDCDAVRPLVPGSPAPPFALETPGGSKTRLADLRGKVVLISFWASWCQPCMREMPWLDQLRQRLGPAGLEVLAINVEDDPKAVREIQTKGLPRLKLLIDDGEVAARYGVQTLPHLVVVDRLGKVAGVQVGAGRQALLEQVTRRALAGAAPAGESGPAATPR